jgi:hypothetical protein
MNKNQSGKNNPNYKHGNNCRGKRCVDCGKEGIHVQATRCEICENKHHAKIMIGNKIRKGKRYNIYYCKECNKEILQETYKRSRLCINCYCLFLRKHKYLHPRFGKILKPNWIKYNNIWMRSNWEVKYAKYLNKNNIKWLYESKTFDLGNTTYTPDFYLPKINTYIEIKGYKSDIFKQKFILFKKKYKDIKIIILDKEKLQKMEVI